MKGLPSDCGGVIGRCVAYSPGWCSRGINFLTSWLVSALLAERERWILWSPLALGSGIALYFALPDEPARWIGPLALVLSIAACWAVRRHLGLLMAFVGLALAAFGFTLAVERSHRLAAPVLEKPTGMISFTARIQEVEPLEHGVRVILDRLHLPPLRQSAPPPESVRVRMPHDVAGLRPGQTIALRASLLPPPMPASPGAYDFSRVAWFKELGAVGYAVEAPEILDDPPQAGWGESLRLWIANRRHDLTDRIVSTIDGAGLDPGVGATAAALITAERGPVPPEVLQGYRDAGLAHILVIAGMHMSMVAGLVFVAIRGLLAAIPPIALRYPIKKWTAAAALLVTFCYLVISGGPVPTQRAFIMNYIILVAVLLDREAISLRSITWAALAVLIMEPEALVSASYQMSFAAVYGLISGYEAAAPVLSRWKQRGHGWTGWAGMHLLGILLTTQIAGTSTALYTIFHFNRYATYGLLGNAVAVPLVGVWVMPAALLAFVLMPFGLDRFGWILMGYGIEAVSHVAMAVSSLPGASFNIPSMPVEALILFTLGGFWLLLWKGKWRLWGLPVMAASILLALLHSPPDLLVDPSGKLVALRTEAGALAINQKRGGRSLKASWLKQAGQGGEAELWEDLPDPPGLCDDLGCAANLKGHQIAFARVGEALAEDCRAADLVFVAVPVRIYCPSASRVIDLIELRGRGTQAVWLKPGGAEIQSSADWQGERPWSHHPLPKRKAVPPPQPSQEDAPDQSENEDGENAAAEAAAQ